MKYFKRIRAGIDPRPFLDEIAGQTDPWSVATGRQDKIEVQREAHAIPLRGLRKSMILGRKRRDVHESRWTGSASGYPCACRFLEDIADALACDLSRARLVRLPAGKRVYPHTDRGEYYRLRGRYHLVLKSTLGSWLQAGDEEVRMQEGELWWFDNKQMHEARNDGGEDRIHLIFDLLPYSNRAAVDAALARARAAQEEAA